MKSILIFILTTALLSSCNYSQERLKDLSDVFDYKGGVRLLPGLGINVEATDLIHVGLGAGTTGYEKFGRRLNRSGLEYPEERQYPNIANNLYFGIGGIDSGGPESYRSFTAWGYHYPDSPHKNAGKPGKHISTFWRFGAEAWLPFVDGGFYLNFGELGDFFAGFFGFDPSKDEGLPLHAEYNFDQPKPPKKTYLNNPNDILWCVKWSPDGSKFAVGGENTLWVFDSETHERTILYPRTPKDFKNVVKDFTVTFLDWHPDGNQLAVSSQGGNINGIFDVETKEYTPLETTHGRGIAWTTHGDRLALTNTDDGHLKIYEAKGKLIHDIPRYKDALGLTAVEWSPNSSLIVTLGKYITIHKDTGEVIKQIQHRTDSEDPVLLLSVRWHRSGEFFAIGDYGNESVHPVVQLWSKEGELLKTIPFKGYSEIRNISWSPDGRTFIAGTDKFMIIKKEGKVILDEEKPYEHNIWGVDFHPEKTLVLLSFENGTVILKNTFTLKETVIVGQ